MSLLYMTINNDSASIAKEYEGLGVSPQVTVEGEQVDNANLDSSL